MTLAELLNALPTSARLTITPEFDTIEPLYFSLCLDVQISITLHSYLFRDNKRIGLSSGLSNGIFRKAEKRELSAIFPS